MAKLYLVATPLGNLEDITLRALRVLREVDLILAEDTRRSRILLQQYQISPKAIESLHEHNERAKCQALVERLQQGTSIALCSDAGTPLLSDPGKILVEEAISAGIAVEPIPGPNAAITALIASGLDTSSFRFTGFPPRQKGARKKLLARLQHETATHIFYESPRRLRETLEDIREVWGERRVCIAREMTKIHEEFLRGSPSTLLAHLPEEILGEITLIVEGAPERPEKTAPEEDLLDLAIKTAVRAGASLKDASSAAAQEVGVSKKIAYSRALELLKDEQ